MRRFIIDTDTASDDAVAILMAHRWPDVQVDAVTIVAGNVPVEMGAKNAGYTIELCGKSTPIFLGNPRPLLREPSWAFFFHGPDGMGGMNYPPPKRPPEAEHAVDALIRLTRARPGEYTLVTLGPLTNIAMALRKAPDVAQKVKQCYVMGGAACTVGNITPAAALGASFSAASGTACPSTSRSQLSNTPRYWAPCSGRRAGLRLSCHA